MKISLEQQTVLTDIEVKILYSEMTDQVKHIETVLLAMNQNIVARCDGKVIQLSPSEIFYIESVDKRTYLYGTNAVYEAGEKLYKMEEALSDFGFVRASKNCILNKYKLREIKILPNSHIEATLSNEEHILVTRKYISDIRNALEKK